MENQLILTVGLPRSGKTTWAKQQGHPIVSPDCVRLALHGQRFYAPAEPIVWATAKLMVAALFKAGHRHVILDACSVTRARRDEWKEYPVVLRVFQTAPEVCMARARLEGDGGIIPVIIRMAEDWDLSADWPLNPFFGEA